MAIPVICPEHYWDVAGLTEEYHHSKALKSNWNIFLEICKQKWEKIMPENYYISVIPENYDISVNDYQNHMETVVTAKGRHTNF